MIMIAADRFVVICFLSAIAVSALIAPRLQLFTNLVCKELDGRQWDPAGEIAGFVGATRPVPCAADPARPGECRQASYECVLLGASSLPSCVSFITSVLQ
jgi:hypothetical protein